MQELSIIFSSPQNHMSTSAKTGSRLFHKKHSKKTGFIVWQLVCCTQPHYLKKAACQTKEGVLTVSISSLPQATKALSWFCRAVLVQVLLLLCRKSKKKETKRVKKKESKKKEVSHLRNKLFREQLTLHGVWVTQLLAVLFSNNHNAELNHPLSYRPHEILILLLYLIIDLEENERREKTRGDLVTFSLFFFFFLKK